MRDEEERDAQLVAHRAHQLQNLPLDGHVERADRFIGNDEPRLLDERYPDGNTLALPAGKLVRPARQALGGKSDLFGDLRDAAAPLGGVVLAIDAQRLL